MPTLTLCMIIRDEERTLGRCLASVRGLVDEIVVVDNDSTDAGMEIVRAAGGIVLSRPAEPTDFAAARNLGLARARGDLILVLDADEVLAPGADAAVRAAIAADPDAGHTVIRRNLFPDSTEPAWVDHAVRLFPNRPEYRFQGRVHETVDGAILATGGRLRNSAIVVEHRMAPPERQRAKWLRYVDLLRAELAEDPDDTDRLVFLLADYHKLGMDAETTAVAERIVELRPADFTARFDAALCCLVHAQDPARALYHLDAALALHPDDPQALHLAAAIRARAPRPPDGDSPDRPGGVVP